jgi:hypothetical protein
MSYIPTKGSPEPPVPGENIVETAVATVETLIAKIPASAALDAEISAVETALAAVLAEVDPDGLKAGERTELLGAAYALTQSGNPAQVQQGIADATTFAQDTPPHPTPWVRRARWIVVNAGGVDPLPGGP